MYVCERCGSKYNSARFATIELCPRCMLRDDVASHLLYTPGNHRPTATNDEPEPDAPSVELG
jgi:hypothetical protein